MSYLDKTTFLQVGLCSGIMGRLHGFRLPPR